MFSTSNPLSERAIGAVLDVVVIAIGLAAIIFNDKFVGAGLVATGVSLLTKEQASQ